MNKLVFLCLLSWVFAGVSSLQAQVMKTDTTVKIGKVGYRITSNNKSRDKNNVTISPIGFDNQMREFSFEIKGRIRKVEIDDLNRDAFPDLVMYVYGSDSLNKGTVIGISSEKNQTVVPVAFPDIVDDAKIREGYRGGDQFMLMEGMLMRRFPLYTIDSANAQPTGKMRQVQYRVVTGEKGALKFQVVRSYDFSKLN